MPYYGGAITDEEWEDMDIVKYALARNENKTISRIYTKGFYFNIAFRSEELLEAFLKHNMDLVKDYLNIK